ncbi:hypothetical protein LHP98_15875 [Rhodobacter sp. Har01]|uniref:hypothetical protein n=1 Tax=Rhodobacter sp. Har01 TaxID=2883999 RepID=UPI001D096885|nr:hypothetical protein [Rhodobacter sp. Har01]MCB6179601.1 hypothetical protein [Rhodobacter sp. Har01]
MFLRPALLAPALLAPALLALAVPVASAEDTTPGQVHTLDLAARLYAHALATDDALSAVTAFRLVQSVTLRDDTSWQKSTEDVTGSEIVFRTLPPEKQREVAQSTAKTSGFSALALVSGEMEAATREIAAGDDELTALVDDAATATARGRIGGANQQVAALAPGKKDTWQIPFAGQERAEIGVFGDGSGGLAWMVADAAGLPVCIDHYSEQPLYCAFTPAANAFYTVTVISRSDVEGQYLLATN